MNGWQLFFFVVYPYICLTVFVFGLIFRYMLTPGEWNARSSELLEHERLRVGSMLFHYGILFSLGGHLAGLLIPTAVLAFLGLSMQSHTALAGFAGRLIVPVVMLGLGILLWRRCANKRVWATTAPMDVVIILFIFLNALTGGYQAYTESYPALGTVGPWIRSVLALQPNPIWLMHLPWYLAVHVVSGLTLFALAPFSRLVHMFSAPVLWFRHPQLTYRKRYGNL